MGKYCPYFQKIEEGKFCIMNTSELMLKFFQVYNYLLIEKAYRPISSWTHP